MTDMTTVSVKESQKQRAYRLVHPNLQFAEWVRDLIDDELGELAEEQEAQEATQDA